MHILYTMEDMHKATIYFILICVVLAFSLGAVVSHIIRGAGNTSIPLAGGASIQMGLGEAVPQTNENLFTAKSALLYDTDTKTIVFQQNAFERKPIASITKLMTAMVALDKGIPWSQNADILPNEYVEGGELILHRDETVSMKDLFNASLLGSANNATMAYVRQLGFTKDEFVQAMNRKAIELNLEQTEFHDVTGLSPKNVSTAYEVAIMANYAFEHYPEISQATSQKEYSFAVQGTGRQHTIHNTNKMIKDWNVPLTGSKTGFLYEAGYCLVVQGADKLKNRVAVIMDSASEDAHFAETNRLLTMQAK